MSCRTLAPPETWHAPFHSGHKIPLQSGSLVTVSSPSSMFKHPSSSIIATYLRVHQSSCVIRRHTHRPSPSSSTVAIAGYGRWRRYLFASHFAASWGERMWEFSSGLMLPRPQCARPRELPERLKTDCPAGMADCACSRELHRTRSTTHVISSPPDVLSTLCPDDCVICLYCSLLSYVWCHLCLYGISVH